jgi:isopenicillin N synthase-like dioxygenase
MHTCGALCCPQWFADKIDHHRSCLRALNYPETKKAPLPGQIRAGQHTGDGVFAHGICSALLALSDYGSITILLQDGIGGLQVQGKVRSPARVCLPWNLRLFC